MFNKQSEIDGQRVTRHARERMDSRGLTSKKVQRVLNYGRIAYVRGAAIYAVGRKEIERFSREGVDLSDIEGVHVVCVSGTILTVYRNRRLRGLRPRGRRGRRW